MFFTRCVSFKKSSRHSEEDSDRQNDNCWFDSILFKENRICPKTF